MSSFLTSADFWRLLDARMDHRVRRLARPVRGILLTVAADGLRLAANCTARAGEYFTDIEIAQHYGFASVPPSGIECIAVPIGGSSGHQVVVGEIDPVTRPTDLVASESAIYSVGGNRVVCRADGSVQVETAAGVGLSIDAAGLVQLAGGGAAVARVGDQVAIVGTDSTGGPITITSATIASGSSLVQAGG